MNDVDLRDWLDSWPYDAEQNVRIVRGANGREFILVRQAMGLEQYEADGRPDGQRCGRMEALFDLHHTHIPGDDHAASQKSLDLSSADCTDLFHEAHATFQRLTLLFRLKQWPRVERDAAHVLALLTFLQQHARCAEDRAQLEPWRPHLLRLQLVARAMILLGNGQHLEAVQTARDTIGILNALTAHAADHRDVEKALMESVRDSLHTHPHLPGSEEACFIRQDDFWTIRYQGHTAFLKCTRGLQCLALLLRSPGREFHVSELLASLPDHSPTATCATTIANEHLAHEEGSHLVIAGLYDGTPILDPRAKAEYRRRLAELRDDLAEAERNNDPTRAARAHEELDAIAHHLATAIGLGGRDRKADSDAERARCTVTKRIKQAIRKIAEAHPALGHHLTARIKTGYFCSYNPHPDRPVAWKF